MAYKDSDFIPFYKIHFANHKTGYIFWMANLSTGNPPEAPIPDPSETANRLHCLKNHEKEFVPTRIDKDDEGNEFKLYETKVLLDCLTVHGFSLDKEFMEVFNYFNKGGSTRTFQRITRSIYREAGRIAFELSPNAVIEEVADWLDGLGYVLNTEERKYFEELKPSQIIEFLRGLSNQTQKRTKKVSKQTNVIDLVQIVELMWKFPGRYTAGGHLAGPKMVLIKSPTD